MSALEGIGTRITPPEAGKARTPEQQAQLREAAQQFESLFVNLLMKSMRNTVVESDLIGNKGGMQTYRALLDEEMSKRAAGGANGLGIADMIIDRYMPETKGIEGTGEKPEFRQLPRQTVRRALEAYGADPARAAAAGGTPLERRAGRFHEAAADTAARYGNVIDAAADETGLDPELILAVIMQESSGRPDARSRAGAEGLMQLMPATAREMGVDDSFDPEQNIRGGSRYLAHLAERFGDDLDLILAGYNAGPGRVERAGFRVPDLAETKNYVERVGSAYRTMKDGPVAGTGKDES